MRILIVAGGTGGHIYPAACLTRYLKRKKNIHRILWIGGKGDLEHKVIPGEEVEFKQITTFPCPRSLFFFEWVRFFLYFFFSFFQSLGYIIDFKPDVVVGMGSFHCFPVGLAAFFCGKPLLLCEQNIRLSLTNRMLLPFACKIALSFALSRDYLSSRVRKKTVLTGNPVREEILNTSREEGIRKMDLEEGKFTLFFLGGSQGARFINELAIETLSLLEKEGLGDGIQFILISGEKDYSWAREKLGKIKIRGKLLPFLSQIHYAYAASDLVISRSGATTLAEITARGLPCVLIPYPFATSGHQMENALALEKERVAKVIPQEKAHPLLLKRLIEEIIQNPPLHSKMGKVSSCWGKPLATQNLANLVLQCARDKK